VFLPTVCPRIWVPASPLYTDPTQLYTDSFSVSPGTDCAPHSGTESINVRYIRGNSEMTAVCHHSVFEMRRRPMQRSGVQTSLKPP